MNTLSGQAREAAARARLQRSRRQAGGLLLAAVLLFIVSALFVQHHPALGYLKAFAEAATVGALLGSIVLSILPIGGGLPILPFMVITYALYSRVVWRDLAYLALAAAMFALVWQPYDTWQATVSMLAENSDFMLVLVIPVLHLYNGEHGPHTRFSKYFFYVFYPAHLWLLALIAYFQAA